MNTIENLNWRYATKKFNADKKIAQQDLESLKESVRLSASSYGFQPYKVLIIEDLEVRKKIQEASYNQSQIVDASHLFVFATQLNTGNEDVDALMNLTAETRGLEVENLKGYSDYIKGAISYLDVSQKTVWNAKQAYIALGSLLIAAAELKIDSCPMEGFVASQYDEILGLKELGLTASVVATLGYRSSEDTTGDYAKVRKPCTELFHVV
jgi:nitroreductase